MPYHPSSREIVTLKSLFRAREDVFAIHWTTGNRSGYMPARPYDPYLYRIQKIKGSSPNLSGNFISLTDEQIAGHLNGEKLIGVYPLLRDNTSWFIAADFDKENWSKACRSVPKNKRVVYILKKTRKTLDSIKLTKSKIHK